MILLHSSGNINYGLLETIDLEEMGEVLAESFSRGEPMAMAVPLLPRDVRDIVSIFGPKAAAEKLTIVARLPTGEMVGALLSDDFATPPPEDLDHVPEAFHPIGGLLDGLDDAYKKDKTIRPGEFLHVFMLGVLPDFAGKKIAQNLVAVSLKNGLKKRYRMAVTEATGTVSQHIFRQAGFTDRLTVSYADYTFQGRQVFGSIRGQVGTILMDKYLT